MPEAFSQSERSIRRCLGSGAALAVLLVFGIGGWGAFAQISGAVIAPGTLVVDSSVKKVQHPTGGVVGELRVRDGDVVRAGEVVIRLDETVARANYTVLSKSADQLIVRRARLLAEQEGERRIDFPPEVLDRSADLKVLMDDERKLFLLRYSARDGQRDQLGERIKQLREQIGGMNEQITAKKREMVLIHEELRGVQELWEKKLISLNRLTALQRDSARLQGELGALNSSVAQTKGRITETELQILQIDQDLRAEVGRELGEIRSRLAELTERMVASQDQLQRIDIRSPQDGVVHQLAVHTVGGVINPSEPLMLIVPRADALRVEVRIAPQDIDNIRVGQKALLKFSAFNQATTPEIEGDVSVVAADVSEDPKSGLTYYRVRISVAEEEIARLAGLKLAPGMPVECFIQSGYRTVLTYLTKPLADHMTRAFRER